jgi:hypothetical protein
LLAIDARGAELKTTVRMAFWLTPGEKSEGRPALNTTTLSDHLVAKHVRIGYRDLAQVLDYRVTFTVPPGERHTFGQFEALTGYMPAEFGRFWQWNAARGRLEPLDDGPGEQNRPVVLSTESGSHAMGVFSPDQPSPGHEARGYGRFRFVPEKVVKWNCVFRVTRPGGLPPGEYRYRMFVPVGTLADVESALARLHTEFKSVPAAP